MIKKGFTLAEVLISLAIVGVIAAVTLPSLMTDTTAAQIGPKLAKAASAFEQANQALLNEIGVDLITDIGHTTAANYTKELDKHLKITNLQSNEYLSADGVSYYISSIAAANTITNPTDPAYKQKIGTVTIDTNSSNNKPNNYATDMFTFTWWNDGSLRPKGAINWDGSSNSSYNGTEHWLKKCDKNTTPANSTYCAGHIFENNLKVLYK